MPSSTRYEVDPYNRLCYRTGRKSGVRGFRTVVDGKFSVTPDNQLKYSAVYPSGPAPLGDGKATVRLNGKWALDKGHHLVYKLDASGGNASGTLKLRGEVIHADAYSLAFLVRTKTKKGRLSMYTLTLGGRWQADKHNRICFTVAREVARPWRSPGASGTLTFTGSWDLDKHNRLTVKLSPRGRRAASTLTFDGRWDITERDRLTYRLSRGAGSAFVFNAKFSRYDRRKRAILYSVGIGAAPRKKTVTLKGTWKLLRDAGLVFEMRYAYEEERVERIVFGAECMVLGGTRVGFKLKNAAGRDLGVEIELERDIFGSDGQAFLRAGAEKGKFEITAGAGWRF